MTRKINIAILGQGFAGTLHEEVLNKDYFNLVAIADLKYTSKDISKSKNEKVKKYQDYELLLQDNSLNLDAVINALPTKIHLQSVKDITNKGLDILLEKPMGINTKEAVEIKNRVEDTGTKIMVALTAHYHPEFVAAKNNLHQIGEILSLDERIHMGQPDFPLHYLSEEHSGKGVELENGIHTMDHFLWLMDKPLVDIETDHKGNEFFGKELYDNARGRVIFPNNIKANFSWRWSSQSEMDYTLKIFGTEGYIQVDGFDKTTLVKNGTVTPLYTPKKVADFNDLDSIRDAHVPGFTDVGTAFGKFLNSTNKELHVNAAINAQKAVDRI